MARQFQSGGDKVVMGDPTEFQSVSTLTWTCWFQSDIVPSGANEDYLMGKVTVPGGDGKRIALSDEGGQVRLAFFVDTNGVTPHSNTADFDVLDTWQFVAVSWSGVGFAPGIYRATLGGKVTEVTYDTRNTGGTGSIDSDVGAAFMLGNRADEARGFNGRIADFRWYDIAITDVDLLTHISLGKHARPDALIGALDLIRNFRDWSPGGNHGTVTGTTIFDQPPISLPWGRKFTPTPPAISTGQTIAVGQSTETDLAQPISAPRIITVGQAVETDLAQSITTPKTVVIGLATETDLAQDIAVDPQHRLINPVAETDLAQNITVDPQHRLISQASETDLAQGITVDPQHRLISPTSETDLAQGITVRKTVPVGQTLETDLAQPITLGVQIIAVGQVVETDLAQTITPASGITPTIDQATEVDLARDVTVNPIARLVSQVAETDFAQAISVRKTIAVAQVDEIDLSQPITSVKIALIQQVLENDLAQVITSRKTGTISQVIETDLSQPINVSTTNTVGLVNEIDLAQGITVNPQRRLIGQAFEFDSARPIAGGDEGGPGTGKTDSIFMGRRLLARLGPLKIGQ